MTASPDALVVAVVAAVAAIAESSVFLLLVVLTDVCISISLLRSLPPVATVYRIKKAGDSL